MLRAASNRLHLHTASILSLASRWHSTTPSITEASQSPNPSTIKPLATPTPSSTQHSSLAEFLAYATRTPLSPTSPTYIGTHYEYTCLSALSLLGLASTRTGGRSDAGIDLLGHWTLPFLPHPIPTLVQCKALKAKAGPNLIRELEGAFPGTPSGWRGADCVGVLCCVREATKGVREAVRACPRAIVWVMIDGNGRVRQMLWNGKAATVGFEGLGVQTLFVPGGEGKLEREAVLMCKGEIWRGGGERALGSEVMKPDPVGL